MAEPQPSEIHEGASTPPPPSGTAEDRKAAAALSSLDAHDDESAAKKGVDTEALGQAMKNLGVGGGDKKMEAQVAPKKPVKIEASDVSLLVEQLELSKAKATELLRAHDGDAIMAMSTFVTISV